MLLVTSNQYNHQYDLEIMITASKRSKRTKGFDIAFSSTFQLFSCLTKKLCEYACEETDIA